MSLSIDEENEVSGSILCLRASSFWRPEWSGSSAWIGHIPFAFWLIDSTRPRVVVELGTQYGASYYAFCQAVKSLKLSTKCHAVDTWAGDGHAKYRDGDEIFARVDSYNRAHYAEFSRLIRLSFDEALDEFPAASIDLLHIDGFHTYEAARHDFESWLPKMSDHGVILFHDTQERKSDFGVHRLWTELAARYPHFEFFHEHGLGVLGVGETLPSAVAALCAFPSTSQRADWIRDVYAGLGANIARGDKKTTKINKGLAATTRKLDEAVALALETQRRNFLVGKRVRFLEKVIRSKERTIACLLEKNREVEVALVSAHEWQKSWFRRAFRRWHQKETGDRHGFLRRLELSVRKRRKKLFARLTARTMVLDAEAPPPAEDPMKSMVRHAMEADLREFFMTRERIKFPAVKDPKVSILIVLYNQAAFTLSCLQNLELEEEMSFELVIVDNHSSDETARLLEQVEGVTVLRNLENTGFVQAVNQAAAVARGEYLLLLNNDAVPRQNSLKHAVHTLESGEGIAAVGGRLILPDGKLQEAGSIIWADGHCLGYARGFPEQSFEVMFRRDVDFCSAAFLLVKRSMFESLGGFDEAFSPAYSEEVDLCLRIHERGWRVVYEPRAVIDHFEFASSGQREEAIAQQEKNIALLKRKHEATLRDHFPADSENILRARSHGAVEARILFLDDFVPVPTKGSGCPRARAMLTVLQQAGYFVTFWSRCQELEWEAVYRTLPPEIEVVLGRPLSELQAFLEERLNYYDVLIVSRPQNMKFLQEIRTAAPELFRGLKVIYDAEAVVALREVGMAAVAGRPMAEAEKEFQLREELNLAKEADAIIVVSEAEAELFRRSGSSDPRIVGHSLIPEPAASRFEQRRGFLFVGRLLDLESPNIDSIRWFVQDILRLIQEELGEDVVVNIAGAHHESICRELVNPSLRWLGPVEDLTGCYAEARVFIAPTRFAAGIPHKVHEAAAHGVPIVATPLLAGQLQWTDGLDLLTGESAREFSQQCIRAYTQQTLWETLQENALGRITRDQSPAIFCRSLLDAISSVRGGSA